MALIGNTLSARVLVINKGKATNVAIYCGTERIAAAVLGGKWEPSQAVKEFQRLPHRFKPTEGNLERLKGYATYKAA